MMDYAVVQPDRIAAIPAVLCAFAHLGDCAQKFYFR
jgi:hypothetical protein